MIFYLLMTSGFGAFRVLKIKKRYDLYLSDELSYNNKKKVDLINYIIKNQYSNNIIVNYLYASYYQFLKSLILIFILFIYLGFHVIH